MKFEVNTYPLLYDLTYLQAVLDNDRDVCAGMLVTGQQLDALEQYARDIERHMAELFLFGESRS